MKALHEKACRMLAIPTIYNCLMLLMCFSGYAAIRFAGALPIHITLVLISLFTTLLALCVLLHYFSSSLYDNSAEFLATMQNRSSRQSLEYRKTLRSMYPLRVQVGTTYCITNGSVVEFIDAMANNTASLLLSF